MSGGAAAPHLPLAAGEDARDLRARRYAEKRFLKHLLQAWKRAAQRPPAPPDPPAA